MAEPIRKPLHRLRPPHTHKRPQSVLVRSRLTADGAEADLLLPRPVPARPALVPAPPLPIPQQVVPPSAALAPPDEPREVSGVSKARSARSFLLAALALHLGVLLAAWLGSPVPDLDPADLLLGGAILLSGGSMLVLGGFRRSPTPGPSPAERERGAD
jgi:hypothetical protein